MARQKTKPTIPTQPLKDGSMTLRSVGFQRSLCFNANDLAWEREESTEFMTLRQTAEILKGSFSEFNEDKAMRLGAALAYYSVFSLAPLLIIAIGVAGLIFGEAAVHKQVSEQLSALVGSGA